MNNQLKKLGVHIPEILLPAQWYGSHEMGGHRLRSVYVPAGILGKRKERGRRESFDTIPDLSGNLSER